MGQGKAWDPEQYCIIATDALGNGWSSSPSNSPEQPGTEFPRFTINVIYYLLPIFISGSGDGLLPSIK